MEKLKLLFKKFCTKEVIFYGIFGVLTTIVNVGTFYILSSILHIEENLSNNIAIFIAVLFAYFTNRKLVFNSNAKNIKEKLIEFFKFMLGRLFTMVVESLGFFLMFNLLGIQELISKISITIIVIILNFFISKFFAFKK
ncbi:MAG TPA: GtrA family protein [Clostridiaceae bacterium]|jgi:putative flippase GtrA|nr:GtrA family protein [Clostridiaceae bacterium]